VPSRPETTQYQNDENGREITDVSPTILETASLAQPVEVNGVWQRPIEGVSMVYSFDDPKAKGTRGTQYFEMFGNRALYHEGWIAVCRHGRLPWQTSGSFSFDDDKWELYNLADDFSEANDLSAKYPDKLHDLQDMFWGEAAKYNVLPLDDRFAERADPSLRPSLIAGRTQFTYLQGAYRIPESSAANIKNKSHVITRSAMDFRSSPHRAAPISFRARLTRWGNCSRTRATRQPCSASGTWAQIHRAFRVRTVSMSSMASPQTLRGATQSLSR